jgi:hypothetical protein
VRIFVLICVLTAALLAGWAAFAMYSLLIGQADGEIVYVALLASGLAIVIAGIGVGLCVRRRREWSVAYLAGSLGVASLSVVVGIWAWAGI